MCCLQVYFRINSQNPYFLFYLDRPLVENRCSWIKALSGAQCVLLELGYLSNMGRTLARRFSWTFVTDKFRRSARNLRTKVKPLNTVQVSNNCVLQRMSYFPFHCLHRPLTQNSCSQRPPPEHPSAKGATASRLKILIFVIYQFWFGN